jgi:regulator of replication initiation timing
MNNKDDIASTIADLRREFEDKIRELQEEIDHLLSENERLQQVINHLRSENERLQQELNVAGITGLEVERESNLVVMRGKDFIVTDNCPMNKLDILESLYPQIFFRFLKQMHYWIYLLN